MEKASLRRFSCRGGWVEEAGEGRGGGGRGCAERFAAVVTTTGSRVTRFGPPTLDHRPEPPTLPAAHLPVPQLLSLGAGAGGGRQPCGPRRRGPLCRRKGGQGGDIHWLAQPKVRQLHVSRGIQQQVVGLDVAVDVASRVDGLQRNHRLHRAQHRLGRAGVLGQQAGRHAGMQAGGAGCTAPQGPTTCAYKQPTPTSSAPARGRSVPRARAGSPYG